jgi:hypothetical protein
MRIYIEFVVLAARAHVGQQAAQKPRPLAT